MRIRVTGSVMALSVGVATPALAEASFDGLGDALVVVTVAAFGYLTLVVALIVFTVMRQSRAMVITAAVGGAVTLLIPIIDHGFLQYQLAQSRKAGIEGTLPDLTNRTPLFINNSTICQRGLCLAVMKLLQDGPV